MAPKATSHKTSMAIPGRLQDAPPHGIEQGDIDFLLTETCTIERVNDDSTTTSDRTVIASDLACSQPQMQIERPQYSTIRERGFSQGATAAVTRIITAVPDETPRQGDKLTVDGVEYNIREADPWPLVEPVMYHIRMERRA